MPDPAAPDANANRPLTMTRTTMDDLPARFAPSGIVLRPMMGTNEAAQWTSIQQNAEPFFAIADDLFVREFGTDDAPVAARCFFAINAETGEAVGTASAWHGGDANARGAEWGRLHWVAVRPDYQRRGIARALVGECLHRMAALGHEKAYLVTSTGRRGAIKLYEEVGFLADVPKAVGK